MTDRTPQHDVDPVLSSAMAQLEAMREQWLRPLVDRIEELSRENGRLAAERDALRVELDAMRVAPEDADVMHKRAPTAHERRKAFWSTPAGAPTMLRTWLRHLTGR